MNGEFVCISGQLEAFFQDTSVTYRECANLNNQRIECAIRCNALKTNNKILQSSQKMTGTQGWCANEGIYGLAYMCQLITM